MKAALLVNILESGGVGVKLIFIYLWFTVNISLKSGVNKLMQCESSRPTKGDNNRVNFIAWIWYFGK